MTLGESKLIMGLLIIVLVGYLVHVIDKNSHPQDHLHKHSLSSYTSDFERNFMRSCVIESGEVDICQCSLDKLESQYNVQEVQDLIERAQEGNPDAIRIVTKTAQSCYDKYKYKHHNQ